MTDERTPRSRSESGPDPESRSNEASASRGTDDHDGTLAELFDPEAVRDDTAPAFDAPWQARAFGIAVSLSHDRDLYEWDDFQQQLIDEIATDDPTVTNDTDVVEELYYEQWLGALERLLIDEGIVTEDEIRQRAAEFAGGDRDASEFVEGDRGHTH